MSAMLPTAQAIDTINNESSPRKRKASPSSSSQATSPKRPRQPDARTASSNQEEKRRNKRLFGGLLSTLSQTNHSTPTQQRRQEIEQRQKERLQRQGAEVEAERRKKGARLLQERQGKEILWEEEIMERRHKRMRLEAGCLATKARPRIFYLPRRLTAMQHDEIRRRKRDVERQIAGEERRFEERKRRYVKAHGVQVADKAEHHYGDKKRFRERVEQEHGTRDGHLEFMLDTSMRTHNSHVDQPVPVAEVGKEAEREDVDRIRLNDVGQAVHDRQDDSEDEIVTTEDMVIY